LSTLPPTAATRGADGGSSALIWLLLAIFGLASAAAFVFAERRPHKKEEPRVDG
jgi:hypothetical protein